MPELRIKTLIKQVEAIINSMNENELETLLLLLSDEGKELIKRNKDLKKRRLNTYQETKPSMYKNE